MLVDAGRAVEAGEAVHDTVGGVGADADGAAVGGDGEDVSGSAEGRDSDPTRIGAERDILKKES